MVRQKEDFVLNKEDEPFESKWIFMLKSKENIVMIVIYLFTYVLTFILKFLFHFYYCKYGHQPRSKLKLIQC